MVISAVWYFDSSVIFLSIAANPFNLSAAVFDKISSRYLERPAEDELQQLLKE